MAAVTYGAALSGLEAELITLETKISAGVSYFIVGLPDDAVKESLFRVESAIAAAGYHMPRQKVLISMAPAGLRKSGAVFDLSIAIGILCESGQLDPAEQYLLAGELSLNGKLRPIKGALSMAIAARKANFKGIILPLANAAEAAIVNEISVYGFEELSQVMRFLNGIDVVEPAAHRTRELFAKGPTFTVDFAEVNGQAAIKRALEIAAAGDHHALLSGPPGSGKTMLARRLPTILPPMDLPAALETSRIYSVAGLLDSEGLIAERPFRAPHHSISDIALVGGGALPQPGEISLAHNGVLFLDELPEFKRKALEVLRQPLESREVSISRANYNFCFPAGFLLIEAMNPCPCGFFGHPERRCSCSLTTIRNYVARISGPILDRIDLHLSVSPVNFSELIAYHVNETSAQIRERVVAARSIQMKRQGVPNARLSADGVRLLEKQLLIQAMETHHLSARSYDRILKVARTIADLAGADEISLTHLSEAISYRCPIS